VCIHIIYHAGFKNFNVLAIRNASTVLYWSKYYIKSENGQTNVARLSPTNESVNSMYSADNTINEKGEHCEESKQTMENKQ
jgi:hypothetical protein